MQHIHSSLRSACETSSLAQPCMRRSVLCHSASASGRVQFDGGSGTAEFAAPEQPPLIAAPAQWAARFDFPHSTQLVLQGVQHCPARHEPKN